jgi:predicted transcriptional regulator
MNSTLEQFNSLITTLRMVENENEKLKPKADALETEEKAIKDDLKNAEEELSKSEQESKTFKLITKRL